MKSADISALLKYRLTTKHFFILFSAHRAQTVLFSDIFYFMQWLLQCHKTKFSHDIKLHDKRMQSIWPEQTATALVIHRSSQWICCLISQESGRAAHFTTAWLRHSPGRFSLPSFLSSITWPIVSFLSLHKQTEICNGIYYIQ